MFINPKPGDVYRKRKPWASVVTGIDVFSGSSLFSVRSSGVHITSVGSMMMIRCVGSRNEVLLYFQFRRLTSYSLITSDLRLSLPVTGETLRRRDRCVALICYTLAFRKTFRAMWIGNGNGPIDGSGALRRKNSTWTNNAAICTCICTSICTVFHALIESDYWRTVSSRLYVSFSRDVG